MPDCPRCHQPVDTRSVKCPYCGTQLKAYGHPGIPLHRSTGEAPLCDSCTYHEDDTCTFPQRPHARECTLYQNRDRTQVKVNQQPTAFRVIRFWFQRYMVWLVLLGLILMSFLLALLR